ncbi:MAG: lipocalin family protein [Albidovulum sp.]|uniref:lipocalin family protein n=1 Tax=Albidovulum sp. TaxID=1872424 RepID=UPI003C877162
MPKPACLLSVLLSMALAGCAERVEEPVAGMSSAAAFDANRFVDVWHVTAVLGEGGCGPLAETWAMTAPDSYRVTGTICGPTGARAFVAPASVTGPGRITREMPQGAEALWVLWVDADYRVAVIGTPSRRFARILSRTPEVRPDLMQAARDVLQFNGYDPAGLRPL